MTAKGWGNSDLARAVWGETTDTKGYKVARNRDRIGVYLRGDGWPEPKTAEKMAEVFGIPKEELMPDVTAATVDREHPELALTMVAGHTDKVHLQVNALVPLTIASQIIALIEQSKTSDGRRKTDGDDNRNGAGAPTQ